MGNEGKELVEGQFVKVINQVHGLDRPAVLDMDT